MSDFLDFFLNAYKNASTFYIILEALAFLFGIVSVWYAKKENILVYPTGIIGTTITTYLLYKVGYFGDMAINVYYSIMSFYGWWNWSRKNNNQIIVIPSYTNTKEKLFGILIALLTMIVTYCIYLFFGKEILTLNYLDIFTSGIFFTAMWYMAKKKIENWTLWIFANLITIPLYAYRELGMLSLQYVIFTILAIQGYLEWKQTINNTTQIASE